MHTDVGGRECAVRRGKQLEVELKLTLDEQHLQKLAQDASPETAESFIADYVDLLPRLVERIVRAVGGRDRNLALDASLNLKTKSWLVGALKMNQLCSELELALALADWAVAHAVARDIELHLPRLQKALQSGPHLALRPRRPKVLQTTAAP
jgi:HPt (histidine-containing phosphotransfer) domain-containing protein